MAKTRNHSLLNNVRSTIGQFTGNRPGGSRRGGARSRGGSGLASQASGFIGGLLSGSDKGKSGRRQGRRRR